MKLYAKGGNQDPLLAEIKAYANAAFARAAAWGGKVAVIGSGFVRGIPDDMTQEEVEPQLARVLSICGEAAEKYGLKAVSEEVMDLLQTLTRMLVDDKIVSVTVQCADSCKAKLAVGGKGEIKITRSEGWSISMSV